ncbi:hypothetical protein [Mesorhizobium sp. 1M-11]|uniref:hypothetical protein n=1 Tax=Mesorhizobium sp. 1M-11 TaxID=1529006 RepID=UPI0006C75B61|nr:hypothetical protein [Mesorhizobium sp. 1M-11]
MLREISEEVRVNLKDRLRDVRHVIRRHRHDSPAQQARQGEEAARPSFPIREIEGLLGHAASAFDDMMSVAETLVPRERSGRMNGLTPKPLGVYFAPGDAALSGERSFRRDMYALAKAVLAERKAISVRVREANFTAIHAVIARQHAELLDRLVRESDWAGRVALVAALSAALLVEFLNHDPLRQGETPTAAVGAGRSFAVSCLAPVALAVGLASVDTSAKPEPDLLEIALLATDARLDRILAACNGNDPLDELTTVFATLLAHLP